MKIAFTATGPDWDAKIDARFGRAAYLVFWDEESRELTSLDNSVAINSAHGAGTATAQKMFDYKPHVMITGNGPGESASNALKRLKMKIFVDAHGLTLEAAYQMYRDGKLKHLQ
ncbi:MAG: NifB/NifX family molybdenum-iron cluster-binding protein [Bacteroidales bacterium]|jgi:predicted Fe-Mo cluster-binding NifX family protein|nr:NifB/NifX family molybdenum-iron cluster-binding protein [Bacteroidales bacterium]